MIKSHLKPSVLIVLMGVFILLLPSIGQADQASLEREVQHLRQRVSQLRIDMQKNALNLRRLIEALDKKFAILSNSSTKSDDQQYLHQQLQEKDAKIRALESRLRQALGNEQQPPFTDNQEERTSQDSLVLQNKAQKPSDKTTSTQTKALSVSQQTSSNQTKKTSDLEVLSGSLSPTTTLSAKELYDQGIDFLSRSDYEGAEKTFRAFLQIYPQNQRVQDARYWLAESFYYQNIFAFAFLEYNALYETFPNGGKAGQALLKSGFAKMELEQYEEAETIFNAVIERYPNSKLAREANHKLGLIGILKKQN